MAKGVRKSVTIPGLLATTAKRRSAEFGDGGFAPYAVELVCYDLRIAAPHTVTLELARDTQAARDAVDRELATHYRPGQLRVGLLVQIASQLQRLRGVAERSRHDQPSPSLSAIAERITFPADIWRLVGARWRTLGYHSLSAYLTGLIRYDLLMGGPHNYATGECRSKVQRALTRKTVLAARRRSGKRKTLLDHLIERAECRRVPRKRLEKIKAQLAHTLRDLSLNKRC